MIVSLGLLTTVLGRPTSTFGDEPSFSEDEVRFFETEVRPILAARCFKCHSAETSRGGLRLDHRDLVLRGGDLGPAASLDDPAASQLLSAIRYEDLEMPPTGRLPDAEIATLTRWLQQGLPWTPGEPIVPSVEAEAAPEPSGPAAAHWAYQPLLPPDLPDVKNSAWCANPLDRFILARLEAADLEPNPPASGRVLLRRLHYDLLGLPPSSGRCEGFPARSIPRGARENG